MTDRLSFDKDNPMLARIEISPDINRDQLSAIGFQIAAEYPILGHLIFISEEKMICEMMFDRPFQKKH